MSGTFLDGVINYPGDRRIHGLRARRVANISNGRVKVRLVGDSKFFRAGREIVLLPGVFVRELPVLSLSEQAQEWGARPQAQTQWSLTATKAEQVDTVYFDFALSPDGAHCLIHALVDSETSSITEDLRFEVVERGQAGEAAQGAVDLAVEWFAERRVVGKRRAAAFVRAVRAACAEGE